MALHYVQVWARFPNDPSEEAELLVDWLFDFSENLTSARVRPFAEKAIPPLMVIDRIVIERE